MSFDTGLLMDNSNALFDHDFSQDLYLGTGKLGSGIKNVGLSFEQTGLSAPQLRPNLSHSSNHHQHQHQHQHHPHLHHHTTNPHHHTTHHHSPSLFGDDSGISHLSSVIGLDVNLGPSSLSQLSTLSPHPSPHHLYKPQKRGFDPVSQSNPKTTKKQKMRTAVAANKVQPEAPPVDPQHAEKRQKHNQIELRRRERMKLHFIKLDDMCKEVQEEEQSTTKGRRRRRSARRDKDSILVSAIKQLEKYNSDIVELKQQLKHATGQVPHIAPASARPAFSPQQVSLWGAANNDEDFGGVNVGGLALFTLSLSGEVTSANLGAQTLLGIDSSTASLPMSLFKNICADDIPTIFPAVQKAQKNVNSSLYLSLRVMSPPPLNTSHRVHILGKPILDDEQKNRVLGFHCVVSEA